MALSQAQWFQKLKDWVPKWVFEKEKSNVAIFQGIAKVLAQSHLDMEDNRDETFIDKAVDEFLDQHGDERSIPRASGETNTTYRPRIKIITNSANCPAIKDIVDNLLIIGEALIVEDVDQTNFLNREGFLNRNIINYNVIYDAFTIFVEQQVPVSTAFLNREDFADREDFISSNVSSLELFQAIVEAVNKNKSFGTSYRLIERAVGV